MSTHLAEQAAEDGWACQLAEAGLHAVSRGGHAVAVTPVGAVTLQLAGDRVRDVALADAERALPWLTSFPLPLTWDIETADADRLFHRDPGFVRLCGSARGTSAPVTTTDVAALLAALDGASEIVGHNILGFDLLALAHLHDGDWEQLAAKSRDTLLLARLADPPRARDTGGSKDKYDLDAVAGRFEVAGKSGDLKALKKEFGGYDKIPTDDPRYVGYLAADVTASRAVAAHLPMTPYGAREHRLASLAGRMTLNGFKVDTELLGERIAEGEQRKADALQALAGHGLPLSRTVMRGRGKAKHEEIEPFGSPLATLEGSAWLGGIWSRYGMKQPPMTDKGKLSTSATVLAAVAAEPECPADLAEILRLMGVVTQVRTVYQTVADHLVGDRVHAKINMGQASGRWSVTAPGLTVFGKRGGRHVERDIFLPEDGHVLISCDLSQVDMRGIAGHCQDPAYMALFEPGQDVHTQIAVQIWGDPKRRSDAKAIGHGANYGLGAKKMIANGHDPKVVYAFFDGMAESFPRMLRWRDEVREIGGRGELLDNGFGRKMRCEPERAYTQAPALMGQGTARDLLCDALLRLPDHFRPYLRAMIHDEVLISVPTEYAAEASQILRDAFTTVWRDVPILCDVSAPGSTWGEVSGGAPRAVRPVRAAEPPVVVGAGQETPEPGTAGKTASGARQVACSVLDPGPITLGRGQFGIDHICDAIEVVEHWNCSRGCARSGDDKARAEFGPGGDCDLLASIAAELPVAEFRIVADAENGYRGQRLECMARQEPVSDPIEVPPQAESAA